MRSIPLVDQIFGQLGICIYIYIERERERKRERVRESIYVYIERETNSNEVWFNFHIRYRGENIAKGLPLFSKN